MTEKSKPVKKKTVQKAPQNLVLKRTIHIPGFSKYEDGKLHAHTGQRYAPGTEVTEDMVEAYEAARKQLGGKTPIENFCE